MNMKLKDALNLRTWAKNILRLRKCEDILVWILHKVMEIAWPSVLCMYKVDFKYVYVLL